MPSENDLARLYEAAFSQGRNRTPSNIYHRWAGWRAEAQKAFMLQHSGVLISQARLLDIGCSSGSLLRSFNGLVLRQVGVEPDVMMAEAAIARLPSSAEIHVGIFRPEQFPDRSFDLVMASHVLEHVPDPVSFVSQMLRITKPDGAAFIEVPQDLPRTVHDLIRTNHKGRLHLLFFQVETLRSACVKAGGQVAKISSFGTDIRFQSAIPVAHHWWLRTLAWYAYRVYYGNPFKIASNRLLSVLGKRFPPSTEHPDRWIRHSIAKDQGSKGIYIRALVKPRSVS